MASSSLKKILTAAAVFGAVWLGVKYVLPVALPFLLGAGLAFAAEPLVGRLAKRFPRGLAAGVGVSATMVAMGALAAIVGALAVRELGNAARALPDIQNTADQGIEVVQNWLVELSHYAPEGIRPALQRTVLDFFDDGTMLLQQVTQRLPGAVGTTLGWLGDGVLALGTGILAAFLISSRLPKLKAAVKARMPACWHEKYLPALRKVRHALGGWLKAQSKLCLVTWGIVTLGFLLLGIPHGVAWAAVVALVDAVPILGTGTILVPWALVYLLQGESLRAIGILLTYGAAMMTRTVLEPRLVGRQLGLDPLTTLGALYLGYRLWGFLGLLLTPILASAIKSLVTAEDK